MFFKNNILIEKDLKVLYIRPNNDLMKALFMEFFAVNHSN